MRNCVLIIILSLTLHPCHGKNRVCVTDKISNEPPNVLPLMMRNGNVIEPSDGVKISDVTGCCSVLKCDDEQEEVSPQMNRRVIGQMPQMNEEQALAVLEDAKAAWKGGAGTWPQMSLGDRIKAIELFLEELKSSRDKIIKVLMWEIGKNVNDATSEFDRTVQFIRQMIEEIKQDPEFNSAWETIGATNVFVRRTAIGVILCLGPYNYPLNETWAIALSALLVGNVLVLKIPTVGGLCHLLTMDAFSKALPTGTINFISGSGRTTMPPLMRTGLIDGLGFIGGSNAADALIKEHPSPHRLKLFLQLEAKNMAIFLSNLFAPDNSSLLDSSIDEAVTGSTSYNGQRCTALKIIFVPHEQAEVFIEKFVTKVEDLAIGLPWDSSKDGGYPKVTPLPNQKRISYMKQLIDDAISKGAKIVNKNGGSIIGGADSTLMVPAVLFPVTKDMDVYYEEQFGPVIPIVPYEDINTVLEYGRDGDYGQQVSIFTSNEGASVASDVLDQFSAVFGKININSQCGRSPDSVPFSGRRSSAMGVMSVKYAVREFSVPTVIAYKDKNSNSDIVNEIQQYSRFMEKL